MIDKFEACHAITKVWEGGWSDHPDDRGGKTMYGITQETLSAWLGRPATNAEIRNLDMGTAKAIYRKNYWDRVAGDVLPAGVDLAVYDWGVNSGPKRAVVALQSILGVKTDGWVGELTIEALRNRDPREIVKLLCDRRMAFLQGLGETQWSKFGKGWTNRVDDIRKKAAARVMHQPAPPAPPTDAPIGGTAKATPSAPVEKTVSTEQKVGGAATIAVGVTTVLGPIAGFWRDNKDIMTDPLFLVVAAALAVVVGFMLFRKAKAAEAQI
jgi:lysozyme family protein